MENFEFKAPVYFNFCAKDALLEDDGADKFLECDNGPGAHEDQYSIKSKPIGARTPTLPELTGITTDDNINVVLSQAMKNLLTASTPSHQGQIHRGTSVRPLVNRFHEAEDVLHRRKDQAGPSNKFISVAEAVRQFQVDTPDRFHSKPKCTRLNPGRNRRRSLSAQPLSTIPASPKLSSHLRSRPVHYMTQEEKEVKEAEEMKGFKLKANPLNPKILEAPKLTVNVEKKTPTKIVPFNLTEVKKRKPETPEIYKFVARPAPAKILEKPQGVPPKKELPLTEPVSPSCIKRMKVFATALGEKDGMKYMTEKEVHHFGIPTAANTERKRTTEVKPFSFEERDRQLLKRKEETIQKHLAEERKAREFHANPLPQCIKSPNHQKEVSTITTQPMPFNLLVDKRGESKQQQLKRKFEEEAMQLQQMAQFKARPATVIFKKPFEPKKSERPLTDITAVELNTQKRTKEREEFDKKVKLEQAEMDVLRRQREEEQKRWVEEEVARLRKEAVHKARPVPKFKPLEILQSDKPLTNPKSPSFCYHARDKYD